VKKCTHCGETKPLDQFYTRRRGAGEARYTVCKACDNARSRARYAANKQEVAAWYVQNRERVLAEKAAQYAANPAKERAKTRAWRAANLAAQRAREAAKTAKRRLALETPLTEFDNFVLEEAHDLRVRREKATGVKWHVDHIVPVSKGGTNEYTNLQVVPAPWNLAKNNRHSERFFATAAP
jgi:5-methylcytosine-specific restriction endonuclease McrA